MKPELKKLLVLNLPYLLFVYLFAKCAVSYTHLSFTSYRWVACRLNCSCTVSPA